VREDEISLRNWYDGTAHLRTWEGTLHLAIECDYNKQFANRFIKSIIATYTNHSCIAGTSMTWTNCLLGQDKNSSAFYGDLTKFCCSQAPERFWKNWKYGGARLTEYLHLLKQKQCSAFAAECNNRTFAVNEFTTLVYDLMCNRSLFFSKCANRYLLRGIDPAPHAISANNVQSDGELALKMFAVNRSLASKHPLDPCIQVGQYETQHGDVPGSDYVELVTTHFSPCGIIWCGANKQHVKRLGMTLWDCMDQR